MGISGKQRIFFEFRYNVLQRVATSGLESEAQHCWPVAKTYVHVRSSVLGLW